MNPKHYTKKTTKFRTLRRSMFDVGCSMFVLFDALCILTSAFLLGCSSPASAPSAPSSITLASPALPPMPPVPPTPASATFAATPHSALATPNLVQPPAQPFTLAADFSPTSMTNLTAFIEASTNLAGVGVPPSGGPRWTRQSAPYPTNGGTLKVPWSNRPVFFRAGYSLP